MGQFFLSKFVKVVRVPKKKKKSLIKRPNLNRVNNRTMAYANDTLDYPIGSHRWYFTDGNCREKNEKWRKDDPHLAVQQPGYFCCDDGLCISSEPSYGYSKEKPPALKIIRRSKLRFSKTESVTMFTILEVRDTESIISVMFSVKLKWFIPCIQFSQTK